MKSEAGQVAGRLGHSDIVIRDELGYLPFSASGGALLFHLATPEYSRSAANDVPFGLEVFDQHLLLDALESDAYPENFGSGCLTEP